LNDTIYQVDKSGFEPGYMLDFGNRKVSEYIKSLDIMELGQRIQQEVPFYSNGRNFENIEYSLFSWVLKYMIEMGCIIKKTKSFSNLESEDMLFRNPFYMDDNEVYTFYDTYDLNFIPKIERMHKLVNFVIMKYSFK